MRFREGAVVVRVGRFEAGKGFETESVAVRFPARCILKHTRGRLSFEQEGDVTRFTLKHEVALTAWAQPFARRIAAKAQRESAAVAKGLKELLEQR
jgi:hypothetical protein